MLNTPHSLTLNQAETIVLQAFRWIANDKKIMNHFVINTGITLGDLTHKIDHPEWLNGLIDFLLSNEKYLTLFCEEHDLAIEKFISMMQILSDQDNNQPWD